MTRRGKRKTGRNEPCPCGSGEKFKRCHGRLSSPPLGPTPEALEVMIGSHEAKEAVRQSQQGKGKPIISTEFQGYRVTAVGNRIHWSKKHQTFTDFLGDYIRKVLDPKWGNAEIAKPLEERHQILKWYDAFCKLQKDNAKNPEGEIQDLPLNGLVSAYYGLAYNLYLLQHNAELQDYLIRRLKMSDSFYAAYYETFVAAWFILAGFELRLENEQDGSRTHPEFIATRDSQSYSVEAKTRQPGKDHFDVGNQLYNALRIASHFPRVIFIDMNVGADADFEEFGAQAMSAIRGREAKLTIKGTAAPPAHVFVTNQPFHLVLDQTRLPQVCLATGFKIPDFGEGSQFTSYTEAHKAKAKHVALYDVQEAMVKYKIPVTFDGELPEFAFSEAKRRFVIGGRIEIAKGKFVTLRSGIVVEAENKAYLTVDGDSENGAIWTAELSDEEVAAYKAHPDTFFGRVVPVSKNVEDPMDMYSFFLNGYKDTPRSKLLELMKDSTDIEELTKMPDDELRYRYAEGLTRSLVAMSEKK